MSKKNRPIIDQNCKDTSNSIRGLDSKSRACIECRYCCEYVNLPLFQGAGYAEFYQNVRGMDLQFRNFMPWVVIYCPCQHLTKDGCGIYKKRPSACRDYDGRLDLFHPEKCKWNEIKEVVK